MDAGRVSEEFRARFGTSPEVVGIAPGRINLIGEHTDYNDGFVFPAAIDRGLYIAASRSSGRRSRLISIELGEGESFDARVVEPPPAESWTKYAAGMSWALRQTGSLPNIDAVIGSDIPIASGISSSAAIEMAFGVVWGAFAPLQLTNKELALAGQRCENGFIGLQSGIMDQMASAMGKAGQAMFLDTRTLEIQYAPIPCHLVIALCDTKQSRELAASAYNERRSQCEEACRALGISKLRDASMAQLEAGRDLMSEVVFRRARHVITENERCQRFLAALHAGDEAAIGDLMRESHASMRDDYEATSVQLDAMADAANGAFGCVGARVTGAGFGGACVALVHRESVKSFKNQTELAYRTATGVNGEVLACEPAEGARLLA